MKTKKGFDVLPDKAMNKSIAFTRKEREQLGLRGLLPYVVASQDQLVERVMEALRRESDDLNRYLLLSSLQERNENLFYRVTMDHIQEIMPLIYTPTVGEACKQFSHIAREPKGFFITPEDQGQIQKILANWPSKDIHIIVVTDGQRILGLGDLGANGMGIPIGKLALYTACAGIPPQHCLPVLLDVGTNNKEFLHDFLYLGYPHKRIESKTYFDIVEEFVVAVQQKYPRALIQFEDFLTPNAYALLNKYRDRILCFNDDIQGTAAVALAGVYASTRITNLKFSDLRIMFLGAGSAATGIADLMVTAFQKEGLNKEQSRKHLWFVDVNGLVVSGRKDLMQHNIPYAHDHKQLNFVDAIDAIQPHVLIGATGVGHTFTKQVIEHMSRINERPVIFALSNPTSHAECTAEQAYKWSNGKAIFASGSPFGKFIYNNQEFHPAQGNNAYVFPGIGLGAIACSARNLPDELFLVAARALSDLVGESELQQGSLYPPLRKLREISFEISMRVAEKAYELGLSRSERSRDMRKWIMDYRYDPHYT
jgi:malate dehydrogenase (oxaloacetate-decarboxylating)(NADP+)